MAIAAGLVGLPNVGKSTLFNALTKSSIPAENYPFCTIDPHLAITQVPDERLEKLASIFKSQKKIYTTVQFVDIAGLVAGASKGEGLGNQFLGNILGVDLILHVLRCFEDPSITHVGNEVDPIGDFETISTELMLKDLEMLQKRVSKVESLLKSAKSKQDAKLIKELEEESKINSELIAALQEGQLETTRKIYDDGRKRASLTPLLSSKNFLIIANLSESDLGNKSYLNNKHYKKLVERFGKDTVIAVSAKIESELAALPQEEATEFMQDMGIVEKGLDNIINQTYRNLKLITFFTCGPKEAHAWSIPKGSSVLSAAGEIHSDLERGFICAEVYNCKDIFELGSEQALKAAGKLRIEGREYIVQDGDLLNIRFNV